MKTEYKMSLCQGRHEIPDAIDGSIFPMEVDPLDISGMETVAAEKLHGVKKLVLYVTGLTVALVTVINVCHKLSISLTLMHYDKASGGYYPQEVK